MSGLHELLSSGVAYRLGWTLLHSLWQGAAVALLFAIALLIVPVRRPAARYAIGCGCLVVLLLMTGLTLVAVSPPVPQAEPIVAEAAGEWLTGAQVVDAEAGLGREPLLFVDASEAESASLRNPRDAASQASAGEVMKSDRTWRGRLARRLAPSLPWMAAAWLAGVLMLSLWRLGGCAATYRLKRRATLPVDGQVAAMALRCCRQLRVSRPVRVLRSMVIRTPAVIGHLRPVILLPVAAVSGLSPAEIEAIIAHELAHIRRHDYLVGLIQSAIEILFFHHPAVWWISRRIRIEREYCCDDLVVAMGQGKLVYAEALTKLAPLAPSLAAALGATGGSLLDRIRRLAGTDDDAQVGRSRSAAGLVLSALLILGAIGAARHLIAKPAESQMDAAATQPAVSPQASRPAAASQPVSDLLSILNSIFAGPTDAAQISPTGEWIHVRSGENELRLAVSGEELAGEWTVGDQSKELRCRSLILSNSASGKSWRLEVKSGKLTLVETNGVAINFVPYDSNVRTEELDEELFSKRVVRVFKPKHLDAAHLAELVRDHYPPPTKPDRDGIMSARADEAGRVILSYAPPLDDRIAALLERLDVPQARESEPLGPQETRRSASSQPDELELILQELAEEQVAERIVRVFQPKHVAPEVLAEAVARTFPPSANDRPDTVITAQADRRTGVLLMSYSPAREREVLTLLDRLDVSGERAGAPADEVRPGTLQVAVEMKHATVSANLDRELQRKFPANEVLSGVWIAEPLDPQQAEYLLTELDRQADGIVDAPRVVTFDGRSAWMELASDSPDVEIDGRSMRYDVPLGVRLDVQPEVDADRKYVRMNVRFKKTGVVSRQGRQVEQTVDAHGTFTLPDRAFILLRTQIKQHRIRARAIGGAPAAAEGDREIVREPMPPDPGAAYSYLLVRPTIIFPPTDDEGPAIAVPNAASRPVSTSTAADDLDVETVVDLFAKANWPGRRFSARVEELMTGPFWGFGGPPTKNTFNMIHKLYVGDGLARIETEEQTLASGQGDPIRVVRETQVYDGTMSRRLRQVIRGEGRTFSGSEWQRDNVAPIVPMLLTHYAAPVTLGRLLEAKLELEPGEHDRQIILRAERDGGVYYRYVIELDKGFHASRIETCTRRSGLNWLSEVTLAQVDGGWFPVERKTYQVNESGERTLSRHTRISELARNTDVPDDLFSLEFPKGAKIWYDPPGEWRVIEEDGGHSSTEGARTSPALEGDHAASRTLIVPPSGIATQPVQGGSGDAAAARALQQALARLEREKTAEALNKLLELNGAAISGIRQLGHPTNSAGIRDVQRIRSAGREYVAVVAGRHGSKRRDAEQLIPHGWGIAFFFGPQGKLEGHLGGESGDDDLNGDDIHLITLGTPDRWFCWVYRSADRGPFTYRSQVHFVEPGLPMAIQFWHYPNQTGWTGKEPYTNPGVPYRHFFWLHEPGGRQGRTIEDLATARDGQQYPMLIGWDPQAIRFRGASQLRFEGTPLYEVDLAHSPYFVPVDTIAPDAATRPAGATPAIQKPQVNS